MCAGCHGHGPPRPAPTLRATTRAQKFEMTASNTFEIDVGSLAS